MLARDVKQTYEVVMDVVDDILQSQCKCSPLAELYLRKRKFDCWLVAIADFQRAGRVCLEACTILEANWDDRAGCSETRDHGCSSSDPWGRSWLHKRWQPWGPRRVFTAAISLWRWGWRWGLTLWWQHAMASQATWSIPTFSSSSSAHASLGVQSIAAACPTTARHERSARC